MRRVKLMKRMNARLISTVVLFITLLTSCGRENTSKSASNSGDASPTAQQTFRDGMRYFIWQDPDYEPSVMIGSSGQPEMITFKIHYARAPGVTKKTAVLRLQSQVEGITSKLQRDHVVDWPSEYGNGGYIYPAFYVSQSMLSGTGVVTVAMYDGGYSEKDGTKTVAINEDLGMPNKIISNILNITLKVN
jgi:hypothetical protein